MNTIILTLTLLTSPNLDACPPNTFACTSGPAIHMREREGFKGNWTFRVKLRIVDYRDLPKYCGGVFTGAAACMVGGDLVTADWGLCSPYLADVGEVIAEVNDIPLAWNDRYLLGHEVWHHVKPGECR